MKKCPYCGKSHQDERTVICSACGANMNEHPTSKTPSGKKGSSSNEKKLWTIIIMLFITIFLAVAVTVVVMNIINDNETSNEVSVDDEKPKDEPSEDPDEPVEPEKPEEPEDPDEPVEPARPSPEDTDCHIINCSTSVTLRKTPNITAEEIVQIPLGATVEDVRYVRNGFCEINYEDYSGYAPVTFLDNPGEIPVRYTAEVVNCEEFITLRTIHSTTGEALDLIPLGAEVDFITLGENGFAFVRYKGQYGFVLDSYLSY